jgi:hypothetical protein
MTETIDQVTATWNASSSALIGYIQPRGYTRRIVLMAIQGPKNSTLNIYRGYVPELSGRLSSITPAAARTYDAADSRPIVIRAGEAGSFVWSGGSTSSTSSATANVVSEVV